MIIKKSQRNNTTQKKADIQPQIPSQPQPQPTVQTNEDKGMLYNMALDRITGVYDGYGEFRTNKDIDFSTYFDDIIGVTRPRKKLEDGSFVDVDSEKILLRFSERRFPYAKSKPIHNSFQVVSEEDCTASIIVRPNNEFFARVLEYGPDVEIVSPDSVRELIKRKVNEMYEKSSLLSLCNISKFS